MTFACHRSDQETCRRKHWPTDKRSDAETTLSPGLSVVQILELAEGKQKAAQTTARQQGNEIAHPALHPLKVLR